MISQDNTHDGIDFYDQDDMEMFLDLENSELVSVSDQSNIRSESIAAARNYFKKNARLNMRINHIDLNALRHKAQEEGIPYQTLIASVLHKYISGALVQK